MKKNGLMIVIAAFTLSLAGSLPGLAENSSVALDEITVTANKMEEDIQKIPQSISVINETKIEEMGLKNSMDILNLIPGMITTPDYGVCVTFRGLKPSVFTENNPVVIYVDGISVTSSYGFDFSLVNIERIEVLRGPQGTLYGRDAIGAVVNIVTKEPDTRWHGKINTEYGSFNTWHSQAAINGPIMADKLFLGLSGQYDRTDGWIENEYPGMNKDAGRKNSRDTDGYLLFTPTDRLRVRLGVQTSSHSRHSENDQSLPYDFAGTGLGYTRLSDFHRDMTKHLSLDVEPDEKIKINAQNLRSSYEFDRFKAESVTTHRLQDMDGIYDADFMAGNPMDGLVNFRDQKLTSWTEELRLASTNRAGLRWVGGLYLDKDENKIVQGMQRAGAMMKSPVDMEMQSASDEDVKTSALFGQVMLPLGQSLELTLGGRYQRINKKIDQKMFILPVQGPFPAKTAGVPPAQTLDLDTTWNAFLPKAALAWFVSDNYTAYASFAHGYMPGGFNYFSMSGGAEENTFTPQKSTNYEIGIKADHDRWRLNMAAFYMDIRDIHIYKSPAPGIFMTDNADRAHSLGVELETTWLPVKGLELSAALSVMQAEYDDFDLGTVKLDGKDMEGAPDHSLLFSVSYHHPMGLYGRTDIRHVGNVHYYDSTAKVLQKADAYTLANARLGWLYENWDIYAFVHNLTDEKYINAFMSGARAGFGDPRTIGVGLSYSF